MRLVALTLSLHMSERGDSCWPCLKTIANESGLNRRTVTRALDELENLGWLVRERGGGVVSTRYSATTPGVLSTPTEGPPGVLSTPTRGLKPLKDVIEDVKEPLPDFPSEKSKLDKDREKLREAWVAAGVTVHRAPYWGAANAELATATKKALALYSVDDVCAAIDAYGQVFASSHHWFKHQWGLAEFLRRGLKNFVPEMNPLQNFYTNGNGANGNGNEHDPNCKHRMTRGLTPAQLRRCKCERCQAKADHMESRGLEYAL